MKSFLKINLIKSFNAGAEWPETFDTNVIIYMQCGKDFELCCIFFLTYLGMTIYFD